MTAFVVQPQTKPLLGYARVPGDKSIGHRALLFSALCHGKVRITGLSGGADNGRSARAMAALGAKLSTEPVQNHDAAAGRAAAADKGGQGASEVLIVEGVGLDGLRPGSDAGEGAAKGAIDPIDIDCGNSGTTIRLLCGLLAAQPFASRLYGDASLSQRPMRRVIDPLTTMGATITGASGARADNVYPPLQIAAATGPLRAITYRMPVASAQVKTAVLLAGLYADGVTRVIEPGAARDHTERMLSYMGAPIRTLEHTSGDSVGVIELDTRGWDRKLQCDAIDVPADPSQAAFILAATLIAPGGIERVTVPGVCINPTRTGFMHVLHAMGALIEREAMHRGGSEPIADLTVSRGAGDALVATEIAGDVVVRAIDEIPILAVVAARAKGTTRIRDAGELRVKESDRIDTTCAMLRALGCEVTAHDDGLTVVGMPDKPFRSARIDAAGDHRIAMAGAVAGLSADGPVRIDGAECTETSFPGFAATLAGLGIDIVVEDT